MTKFLKDMFDSSTTTSFARGATLFTVLTGCWCLIYLVVKRTALPDPTTLAALAFWMTAPYAINKGASLFGKEPAGSPGGKVDLQAGSSERQVAMHSIGVGGLIAIAILIAAFWVLFTWTPGNVTWH